MIHFEAKQFIERAHDYPVVSGPVLKAQWHFLRTAPKATLELWSEVFLGTLGSANYMVGGLGILPEAARCADEIVKLGITHIHAHFANHPTDTCGA